ncbi:N-acetyl-gamma-glutamyl-phosphate reductase [Buchnera aphidicola (Melanaphis sacchari)]|uniref:N-acetyl-gamma-glutamyl-phosphate reductase n=1 Tax=Buchnera aphidicola (Melanaphis sacchari) TaxID=2173854 RepID=A0A2U8DFW3_9GAMM|nr:N-acetyl-gamma-glutamyl-phosphate reductase [Buchnera aphidicola]AWH90710.1 N-acetyl-gamma-glutamyl-phosphate reductase [Buchnera aphidicola (Melanaphis sacchari)]
MLNVLIVGASGYTGAELVNYIHRHTFAKIRKIFVAKNSKNSGKLFSELHQEFTNIIDLPFEEINKSSIINKDIHAVFLATDHHISHFLVPFFLSLNCVVLDLSGSYRMQNIEVYKKYYGFSHKYPEILKNSVYGLAEWNQKKIRRAQLISVPGCYATCVQLALKPILEADFLSSKYIPIVNAISGVSGSGKNPNMNNSFCEVSLQPYNIFKHRHTPEIIEHLGIPIIFIPHLGPFPRGIIATITCQLKCNLELIDIYNIYNNFYKDKSLIRIYKKYLPSIKSVAKLPFCDIGFTIKDKYIVIVVAEDNLLKGAAAQAVQCFNIRFGFSETESILYS